MDLYFSLYQSYKGFLTLDSIRNSCDAFKISDKVTVAPDQATAQAPDKVIAPSGYVTYYQKD